MSRYKRRVDSNQRNIVDALRDIPGVTVELGHDDILVGYNGVTRWYELKNHNTISKKTGEVRHSAIKKSQHILLDKWTGHYKIVSTLDEILEDLGL